VLAGANHFSIVDRLDPTLPATALDFQASQPQAEIRSIIAEVIGLFIDLQLHPQPQAAKQLAQLLMRNPLIASFESK